MFHGMTYDGTRPFWLLPYFQFEYNRSIMPHFVIDRSYMHIGTNRLLAIGKISLTDILAIVF